MKKISKIIKNNITLVIGIILGVAITGGMAVYAATVAASSVTYTSNGQSTVQTALDTLYIRLSSKEMQCPGCVYRKSTTQKYNVNSSSSSKTDANSKLTSSEYTTDYTTLNSNYFLGHVIDGDGHILLSYACGINNRVFFCLRGVDSDQSSLTYKPFYHEAVNRMNKVFSGCNAINSDSDPYSYCIGAVHVYAYSSGGINVKSGPKYCNVSPDGTSHCYY